MSDPTVQPTQGSKHGSLETSPKTRLKKEKSKIREVEAEVTHDGKIIYADESGAQQEYIIDNYHDFNVAVGMCQTEGLEAMEVSHKFFDILSKGKETPFVITGTPHVKVFRVGQMDKGLKILQLSIEKMSDLRAKKAREEAAKKKKAEDEITDL